MRKLRQINDALPGLTGGIFLYGALLQIVASALGSGRLYDAVGLWAGIGCAVYMGIHMAVTLRRFLGEARGPGQIPGGCGFALCGGARCVRAASGFPSRKSRSGLLWRHGPESERISSAVLAQTVSWR